MKMSQLHRVLLALTLVALLAPRLANASVPMAPQVVGLMFHSDHCGSCKILDPKVKAAQASFAKEPILFLTFDHTDAATQTQAALLADATGMGEIYAAQNKASGFMLLVDPNSREVMAKLSRDMSVAEIETAIRNAFGRSV